MQQTCSFVLIPEWRNMGENPNVIIDEEKMTEEQLYDSVFWASVNLLKEYVPLLVNETFGTHYSKNAKVTLLSNKKVVETSNDELKRREVDALLELSEPPEYEKVRHFHFECETMGRKNIVDILRNSMERRNPFRNL